MISYFMESWKQSEEKHITQGSCQYTLAFVRSAVTTRACYTTCLCFIQRSCYSEN